MSIYALVFLGSTPVGGPLIGWISQQLSPRYGLAVGGVASVAAGLVMAVSVTHGRFVPPGRLRRGARLVRSGPVEPVPTPEAAAAGVAAT
jgi:hypothetical protein